MKTVYTTYEEPLEGRNFNKDEMHQVYLDMVDKNEYPSFSIWLTDMLRSGVFEEEEVPETMDDWMEYNGVSWSDFI